MKLANYWLIKGECAFKHAWIQPQILYLLWTERTLQFMMNPAYTIEAASAFIKRTEFRRKKSYKAWLDMVATKRKH